MIKAERGCKTRSDNDSYIMNTPQNIPDMDNTQLLTDLLHRH